MERPTEMTRWDQIFHKALRTTRKIRSWDPQYMVIKKGDLEQLVKALNRDQYKEIDGVLVKNAGVRVCKRTKCSRKFLRVSGAQKFCTKFCSKEWFKAHTNETQKAFRRAYRSGTIDLVAIEAEIAEAMKEY